MIICIDGANFVGKSTIINEIKKKLHNIKIIEDYEIKEMADKLGNYLDARLEIQKKYNLASTKDDIIICRWFPSMYVFDYSKDYLKFNMDIRNLIEPDFTFVIGASMFNLIKRQNSRTGFKLQKNIFEQLVLYKNIARKMKYKYYKNNNIKQKNRIVKEIIDTIVNTNISNENK